MLSINSGQDYSSIVNMKLVIPAGVSFDISILDDNIYESVEMLTVFISSTQPNIMILEDSDIATVTIRDISRTLYCMICINMHNNIILGSTSMKHISVVYSVNHNESEVFFSKVFKCHLILSHIWCQKATRENFV